MAPKITTGGLAGLQYEACSLQELRSFLRSRTTTTRPKTYLRKQFCSGLSHCSLISKLQDLDKEAVFRFQGLPTELRILVYHELLVREDPDSSKQLFTAILATSKAVNAEASPELHIKTNLRITIEATAKKSHGSITETSFRTGQYQKSLLAHPVSSIITPSWEIYNTLPAMLGKLSKITLQIILRSDHYRVLLNPKLYAKQFNQINQILAALTATWRISGALQKLKVQVLDHTGSVCTPISSAASNGILATGEMDVEELKRILYPLSTLDRNVTIDAAYTPRAVVEYIDQQREKMAPTPPNLFTVYADLTIRVSELVAKVRNAGRCCSQLGFKDRKKCGICCLEDALAEARGSLADSKIKSERSQYLLVSNMGHVESLLIGGKVRMLVKEAEEVDETRSLVCSTLLKV